MLPTNLVPAAMHTKVGGKHNTADEEEQGIQRIRSDDEPRRYSESLDNGSGDEVEEGEHSEDGDEHDVVDD